MAKLTLDNFSKEMEKILEEYSDDVKSNLDVATKKVTTQGVKLLRAESKAKFGTTPKRDKKYAATWTSSFESKRLSAQGTIYNTQAGLPHLLENGHALVAGGRKIGEVAGREHIAKVENELIRLMEQEVKTKL